MRAFSLALFSFLPRLVQPSPYFDVVGVGRARPPPFYFSVDSSTSDVHAATASFEKLINEQLTELDDRLANSADTLVEPIEW